MKRAQTNKTTLGCRRTAADVAVLLAGMAFDNGANSLKPRRAERDTMETLPAGHPVSWGALWGEGFPRDGVPDFPGLRPIGAFEPSHVQENVVDI